jgi:hypothetical protein
MAWNVDNFLHSLCLHLAGATSLAYLTEPRAIWRHQAVAAAAASTYSTLRIYGGPALGHDPSERVAIQVSTVGPTAAAALGQARALYEAMRDGQGLPARGRTITAVTTAGVADGSWRIIAWDPTGPPGVIGTDETGATAAWSFDVAFGR